MINILKKEFTIYTALLTVLIFSMHPDMISEPTIRLGLMQEHENYIHPLLYTFFVYLILYFLRAIIGFIMKFVKRSEVD